MDLFRKLTIDSPVNEAGFKSGKADDIIEQVFQKAMDAYQRRTAQTAAQALPVISDESDDLRWFALDDLPGDLDASMRSLLDAAKASGR